jgi:beta-galactosidase
MRFLSGRAALFFASALLLASSLLGAPPAGPAKPFDLTGWNGGRFVFGVDYYPEHWPESQWDSDARMMKDAGINFVRLAEFAWVKMEPAEGQFDFAWLDRAIQVLNAQGIKVMLGTPTAAPPAWLYAKFPDIATMNENGVRHRFGSRRDYCLHNPNFLAATRRIVTAMAEHYKNHPGVIGWQIDNELGNPYCFDAFCQKAFQDYARNKFKTLDALNQAWGTIFWGHTYTDWSQVPLPWNTLFGAHNPSLALDHRRFHSRATRDYLKLQVDLLRKIAPKQPITHNAMGYFDQVDYSELFEPVDFLAWDNYPMFGEDYSYYFGTSLAHALMRGAKDNQNFIVMEQQAGLPGWLSFWGRQAAPGLYRVWTYQAVANGADGMVYFRWRTSRFGSEQYWQGVLDQDSHPNARFRMVSRMGKEFAQLTELLRGSKIKSDVAILVSPDSRWAFRIQPLTREFDYNRQMRMYYEGFRRHGASVDAVFPQHDFSKYKILVAPSLFVVTPDLAAKLRQFVEGGGTLVLSYRSGVKDQHNVYTDRTLPGPLAELAGIAIRDFDPHTNQEQEVVDDEGVRYPARAWFDILEPTTADVLATYTKGYYAGKPAATVNRVGTGTVIYIGTEVAEPGYARLAAFVCDEKGVSVAPAMPEGVEYAERDKDGKKIIFLMNYTEKPQTVTLGAPLSNALTGGTEPASVEIPAFDVKVLTK